METNIKEELIAEFNSAWIMIQNIDERRGKFFQYFNLFFGAILTAAIAVKSSLVLIVGILAGLGTLYILWSERKANIRYRKKNKSNTGNILKRSI